MATEVFLPKMSDNMEAGVIVAWLVKDGERVEKGQPILEVETDKAAVELEAPEGGILRGIRPGVEPGAIVPVGETIAFIALTLDELVPSLVSLGATRAHAVGTGMEPPAAQTRSADLTEAAETGPVRATPPVRRLARRLGIELQEVTGTGPDGRVTERDLHAFVDEKNRVQSPRTLSVSPRVAEPRQMSPVARRMAEAHGVDLTQVQAGNARGRIRTKDVRAFLESAQTGLAGTGVEGEAEWVNLTRAQLTTGRRMLQSLQTAPQFSLTSIVDMTRALELREAESARIEAETGVRPSVTGLLIRVVADALNRYRRVNASFVEGRVKLHRQVNIGVAVGTEQGLLVPVIRNADKKSLADITRELKSLQEKAGRLRFGPSDLSGGTFTISNLGMFGVDNFYAIVNPPESAILAVGRIVKTPVGLPDERIVLRPMMNITLSIDHRCLDGQQGAEFLALVKQRLEQLSPIS